MARCLRREGDTLGLRDGVGMGMGVGLIDLWIRLYIATI